MDRIYVMQLVRSFQVGELTRREFLRRVTVAVGSATAANMLLAACSQAPAQTPPPVVVEPTPTAEPVSPATATTAPMETPTLPAESAAATPTTQAAAPTEPAAGSNLVTEMVSYQDANGEQLMGYLARPADGEPRPAVVVIQEWWGLNDHIKDVARRFAGEGFVALAPDLYHGQVTSEPDEARKLVMELDMAEAVREIQRAVGFLQSQPYVAGPKVGIVGFCMGGGLALQTTVAEANLAATVAFYGQPLSPDEAAQAKAPILGLYGSADQGISEDAVKTMQAALDQAGIKNEFHIYEGAQHAFFNDTRTSYNPEAAADAWSRTLAWFRDYLKG